MVVFWKIPTKVNRNILITLPLLENYKMPNIIPRILFISDSEITTRLFSPVAKCILKLATDVEIKLLDVSKFVAAQNQNEFIKHKNDLFTENGFLVDVLEPDDETKDNSVNAYVSRLSNAYNELRPQLIVIPHEFGWAFYAARLAASLDIKTYHIQHGFWGPYNFGEQTLVMAKRQEGGAARVERPSTVGNTLKEFLLNEEQIFKEYLRKNINQVRLLSRKLSLRQKDPQRVLFQSPGTTSVGANTTRKGVWGPYYQRRMIAAGIKPASIDIVGSVLTDHFFSQPIKSYEDICQEYGMDRSQKEFVIYFWDPYERYPYMLTQYDQKKVFVDVNRTIKHYQPQMNVLILAHPRDSIEEHQRWINHAGLDHVYIGRTNMNHNSLFTHSKLVIGTLSTALAEATIFRKPILQLAFLVYDNLTPQLIEMGAVVPILNRLHLRDQIEKILFNKPFVDRVIMNQEHFIDEIFYRCDGKAGERAAMSILKAAGV